MSSGIFFQTISIFYMVLLLIVYFAKRRLDSIENKIFIVLMITNILGLFIDVLSIFTIFHMDKIPIINSIVTKLYLVYLLTWIHMFTIYIFAISRKNDNSFNKKAKFILIMLITNLFIMTVLPLGYKKTNDFVYSYGLSATYTYLISGLLILSWVVCMIANYKDLKHKKYLPLFIFITIGVLVMVLQYYNPGLLMMTSMETFVTFLMYFTIENPDMKLIDELNLAKEQAEKANEAKSDFLSSMSHEIRTPLNAIVGFSQALAEEDIPNEAKEEVKDIIMASNVLLEIVNGILDISKIEANKIEIVNSGYRFKEVFDDLIVLTKARMGEKPLDFRFKYDDSIPPYLYGDHMRVKQVILNLLTNAIKYTKEGFVDFRVSSVIDGDVCRLIISVQDSGIGIKKENINKLFEKFSRLDLDKNITIEGTGLGLAITKKLVELMNGNIVVQSDYGKGSKFTVALDQKIMDNDVDLIESKEIHNDFSEIEILEDETDVYNNSSIDLPRLLIVDDNKLNLKVAERLLKGYNVEVHSLESGQACIDEIESGKRYDLIFLDDMMPKMSGVETLKILKQNSEFKTPVIMLTANAITGMKEKYLKDGFNDYIAKPIDKIELDKIIHKYLLDNNVN